MLIWYKLFVDFGFTGFKANTPILPKTYITVRDGKGGRKMGFNRGTKGRFGGRFSYSAGTDTNGSESIMILPEEPEEPEEKREINENGIALGNDNNITYELTNVTPAETIIDTTMQEVVPKDHVHESVAISSLQYEHTADQEEEMPVLPGQDQGERAKDKEMVTQKNISVNYSGVKPKTANQSTGSSNQKNKQNQNQAQGSTAPKTTTTAKKTSQKSTHQHDKKANSNANTPQAMEKVSRAKEKAIKKVNHKLALIKAKLPQ